MNVSRRFQTKFLNLIGARKSALELSRGRLTMLRILFMFAFVLIGVRVLDLSVISYNVANDDGVNVAVEEDAPAHSRGRILDRNGVILATSLEMASAYADPMRIIDADHTARAIVKILPELSYGKVLQKLQSKRRFVWLKRHLTPEQHYALNAIGDPGISFVTEERRLYPQGPLMSHVVGYADIDGKGLSGIERAYDGYLRGGKGDLVLSVDSRLQHVVRESLADAIKTYSAKAGNAVILDVVTGEVLASVSLPDFDLHDPGSADPVARFNRNTLGVYEMGSTFKVFSTAALLEFVGSSLGKKFDATQPLKEGRFTISDYHPEKRSLTIPEVFIYSSNIGAALMGQMVGTDRLRDFYRDLGFFQSADIEILENGSPLVPSPWRDINTLTASYGHGIAVTPIQLIAAASALVNGGILLRPTFIKRIDERLADNPAVRVVSSQTSHRMRQLMRLTVTHGTGSHADIPGFWVGGKTGTAEKPGKSGYDRHRLISSFLGVFPTQNPRYAILVMVDEPKGVKKSFGYATGGWVAAPVVGNIVRRMTAILGVEPDFKTEDLAESLVKYLQNKERVLASYGRD